MVSDYIYERPHSKEEEGSVQMGTQIKGWDYW